LRGFSIFLCLVLHGMLLVPFCTYLKTRPVEVKLGYVPHPKVLKAASADHTLLVAETAVLKVYFYFGTLVQKFRDNVIHRSEYVNMYRTLLTALHLDPYSEDAYYFAQAAFTWELQRIEEVNELLRLSMKYRTWDEQIPFYLGFNHAYFLHDYAQAARYMQRAAEISGNPLYTKLAARYFYESNQTAFGLAFLNSMIDQSKDKAVRETYLLRRTALQAVDALETAAAAFRKRFARQPADLEELVASGIVGEIPRDPYGGRFYLDEKGRVRTSSKFASLIPESSPDRLEQP
jgi:tetratricopeptide (TPR) repeat protein